MADYDNTNRGVLFKNDRKEKETHPDYKGSVNVEGTEFWLDAWIKTSAKGKFMSLSVKPKDAKPTPSQAPKPAGGSGFDDMDDDLPFISCNFALETLTSKAKRMARYDF